MLIFLFLVLKLDITKEFADVCVGGGALCLCLYLDLVQLRIASCLSFGGTICIKYSFARWSLVNEFTGMFANALVMIALERFFLVYMEYCQFLALSI